MLNNEALNIKGCFSAGDNRICRTKRLMDTHVEDVTSVMGQGRDYILCVKRSVVDCCCANGRGRRRKGWKCGRNRYEIWVIDDEEVLLGSERGRIGRRTREIAAWKMARGVEDLDARQ